jgi:two-component system, LuxR family, sensor histidine kinase TtrS
MRKLMLVLGVAAVSFLSYMGSAAADVKIGVVAPRGELLTMTRWAEFGNYLTHELGQPVKILPLSPPKVVPAARSGDVNFVLSHAAHTIVIQEKFGGTPLATLNSLNGSEFAGVIVTKKGSGITRVDQLRGKSVMSLDKSAAGGYIFQTYYLMQHGIDPATDLGSLKVGKKQDDLVLAVDAGLIDAAFVRSGVLEQMAKEGKIRLDHFSVVDQKTDASLPLLHTTRLYPEWFMSSVGKTAPDLAEKVKAAILKLTPQAAAARAARIRGFIEPLSLDGMKEALRALKLAPYTP